jgi:hypothetical protein
LTSIAHKFVKQLTAAMCMALVLMGVVVSGHAQATHVPGNFSIADQPCHHAMANPEASGAPTVLDLCRELCLNKIPHEAMTAALPTLTAPRTTTDLPFATLPPTISLGLTGHTPDLGRPSAAPPLRPAAPTQHQRLRI